MSTAANNEQKSRGPVRVGLVADGARAAPLVAAIDGCLLIQPLGQAGLPPGTGLRDVPRFDDPRTLLAEPGLEAVLFATGTRGEVEFVRMAAERGLHVWRYPPLARSFAEGTELVTRLRQLPTIHRVASWWEYVADHVWHELHWPDGFTPRFSDLRVNAPQPKAVPGGVRSNDATAGVLGDAGYALLEALVAVRGLPDTVDAVIGRFRAASAAAGREVEDTAAAILRYADGGAAALRATWDLPGHEFMLAHHAHNASVTLTDEVVVLLDGGGQTLDQRPLPSDFLASDLLRFAELVRSGARDRAAALLERHLTVTALLEAIHLAARTGHPEAPLKLYQVQGWPEPRS